jgi:hypothetical protein
VRGAGKSTIIKLLIEFAEHKESEGDRDTFPSPVVGSPGSQPTSADVHMYADPSTFDSKTPLLYADCEGLGGGEQIPRAVQSRDRVQRRKAIAGGTKRFLQWADVSERRQRSFIVSQLYPRLLYTFSDVIIFVVTNKK